MPHGAESAFGFDISEALDQTQLSRLRAYNQTDSQAKGDEYETVGQQSNDERSGADETF